jgi:F-type H+-transporting ATPase subunit delta
MPQGAVPRRYAEAAFALAREQGKLDRWKADLRMAQGVLSAPNVLALLADPNVSEAHKRQVIDSQFPVALDPNVRNLLYLLADRGRITSLARVVDEFVEFANREQGIVVADVTTAIPLDARGQQAVAERLKRLAGAKQVEVRASVDPAILGGIVARIGDELYDGSVRTQLTQLAERIS